MAHKTSKKTKKPLETSLGKASPNEKETDLSHIRKPIDTSIFGINEVISLLQSATQEVKNYVSYECDILYECRVCRSIFRSLANFILHKRNYCKERFSHLYYLNDSETCQDSEPSASTLDEINKPTALDRKEKSLTPVIEKLIEKQHVNQLAREALTEDLSLNENKKDSEIYDKDKPVDKTHDVILEKIETSNAAVFQTLFRNFYEKSHKPELMKSEIMEIHGIQDSDEVVLGVDGKICTYETNRLNENPFYSRNSFVCTECNLLFSTKKTLTYHIKCKHNQSRLVYVCPDCKDTFANPWCVYRHLLKIHRMTNKQIRRLREQIHNSCIRRDQESVLKKKKQEEKEMPDEENQWLNNFEGDNDLQMCGGCGKRFERKAALHSHSQMCAKRIAVCNSIKENNAKKKEEENSDKCNRTSKPEKLNTGPILKGACKRKAQVLKIYERKRKESMKDNQKKEMSKPMPLVYDVEEHIDAQKVFKIIGVPDSYIKLEEHKQDNTKKQTAKDTTYSKFQNHHENIKEDVSIKVVDESQEILKEAAVYKELPFEDIKEKHNEHSQSCEQIQEIDDDSSDLMNSEVSFEVFCKKVAERINNNTEKKKVKNEDLMKCLEDTPRMHFNDNHDLIQKGENGNGFYLDNNQTNDEDDDVVIVESDEPIETSNLPSSSHLPHINVKNLEAMIGVSPEYHKKILENEQFLPNNDNGFVGFANDEQSKNSVDNNVTKSDAVVQGYERCQGELRPNRLKRKRGFSLDQKLSRESKFSNKLEGSKQDINFIAKASPYMDQDRCMCLACNLTYNSISELLWHMSAHFSWFRFQCSKCSFVSFKKSSSILHAKEEHKINEKSISSVVLPIPNWKTVLMAHNFSLLQNNIDLSRGKHTDEIIFESSDEHLSNDSATSKGIDESFNEALIFSEVKNDTENYSDFLLNLNRSSPSESIDVDENSQDSQKLHISEELDVIPVNVSQIIKSAVSQHEINHNLDLKEDMFEPTEIAEEIGEDYDFLPEHTIKEEKCDNVDEKFDLLVGNEIMIEDINSDQETTTQTVLEKAVINARPTRNRIKTQQEDFYYDLNRVVKLSESAKGKTISSQKFKKIMCYKK